MAASSFFSFLPSMTPVRIVAKNEIAVHDWLTRYVINYPFRTCVIFVSVGRSYALERLFTLCILTCADITSLRTCNLAASHTDVFCVPWWRKLNSAPGCTFQQKKRLHRIEGVPLQLAVPLFQAVCCMWHFSLAYSKEGEGERSRNRMTRFMCLL